MIGTAGVQKRTTNGQTGGGSSPFQRAEKTETSILDTDAKWAGKEVEKRKAQSGSEQEIDKFA